MIEVPIINSKEKVTINPAKGFMELNHDLVSQVVYCLNYRKKEQPGLAKGRSDVRGGGRKPWKQKGTGRARAGTIRSPLFVGGGVTFGPTKEKANKKISKKMKSLAIGQLFVKKIKSKEVMCLDKLEVKDNKTKVAAESIQSIPASIILVIDKSEQAKSVAYRNIPNLTVSLFSHISPDNLISNQILLFTRKSIEALTSKLEER